jgi:hypothetical protein
MGDDINQTNRIFQIIEEKYDEIKIKFLKSSKNSLNMPFNEDVFHDTIINCSKINWDNNISDNEIINYMYKAYKQNILRENNYAYNKLSVDIDKLPDIPVNDNFEYQDLIFNIQKYIVDKYGEQTFNQCYDWIVNNKSIREIEEIYQTNNLTYKLKKIKNEVAKKFLNDII